MKIILFTLITLLALVCIILLIDIIPILKRWVARIHIGQWASTEEWRMAVEKALLRQLKTPPRVPVSDNTRLTIIERLKGTYSNKNLQCWQQAALLLGANELCECKEVKDQIEGIINNKIDPKTGEWYEWNESADSAMLAYAVLSSPVSNKQKIKPAMEKTASMLLDKADKYGSVPYNSDVSNIRFVDTIGMICPFLMRYGMEYDCEEAVNVAYKQIEEYLFYGLHPTQKLPVHCFDKLSNAPLGIYGWGRGCGWFATGLMDSYLSLDSPIQSNNVKDTPLMSKSDKYADIQRELLKQMALLASAVEKFQLENGAWDRQIFLKDTGETTATAMLGWFMKKMHDLTGDERYKISAERAKSFIISSTRLNGIVDYAQGDTKGVGFYSSKLDAMPAALGFAARNF